MAFLICTRAPFLFGRKIRGALSTQKKQSASWGYPEGTLKSQIPREQRSPTRSRQTRATLVANAWDGRCFHILPLTVLWLCCLPVDASIWATLSTRAEHANQWLVEPYDTPFQALWGLEGRQFMETYIGLQHPSVAEIVAPFSHLFLPPSDNLNGYSKYREALGFSSKGLPQPDLRECDCREEALQPAVNSQAPTSPRMGGRGWSHTASPTWSTLPQRTLCSSTPWTQP